MTRDSTRSQARSRGWRTGSNGPLRFNRDFTRIGVGRITNSSRTTDPREFKRRDDLLTKLAQWGYADVLRAFKEGRLTIEQLLDAERKQQLRSADLLSLLTLSRPLWDAVAATLPLMAPSDGTRKRYEVSLDALQTKGAHYLGERCIVADLERISWSRLRDDWGSSAADWNHLRRAVSAFLTKLLGDKYHPFRRRVVAAIPLATEVGRVPDLTPQLFWKVVEHIPRAYQPCFVTRVATGLRIGEYLKLTRFSLKPATHTISALGTKTSTSAEDVSVHPSLWQYVERAVPAPIGYKALRRYWTKACEKAGVSVRIHDLRHCFGQWSVNAGVPESKVQRALRHKSPAMTRRYVTTREKGEAAKAVGDALLGHPATEQAAQVVAQGKTNGNA